MVRSGAGKDDQAGEGITGGASGVGRRHDGRPGAGTADREMAAAYAALLARLSGAAKDELVKDQVGWIANRNRACRTDPDNIEGCLKSRYAARIKNLRAYAQGTYPAISEQSLAKQGKLGKITWSYDLTYP